MNRDPVKEPKIGDTWREKNSNYTVTVVKIENFYIKCETNDNGTHHFDYNWFEKYMRDKYDFIGQSISHLQKRILEKQNELNELVDELCKLTFQN